MKQKVSVIIVTHLTDAQEFMGRDIHEMKKALTFCKYLLLKYSNTDKEIDPEEEFHKFSSINHNKLKDLLNVK